MSANLCALVHIVCIGKHHLYLLSVPSCQSHEDKHAHIADDKVEHGVTDKDIHQGGYDKSDETHEEQLAHRTQVCLCHRAIG